MLPGNTGLVGSSCTFMFLYDMNLLCIFFLVFKSGFEFMLCPSFINASSVSLRFFSSTLACISCFFFSINSCCLYISSNLSPDLFLDFMLEDMVDAVCLEQSLEMRWSIQLKIWT
uniref:Uncharacterized protein n=1 Tax=Cacopsylla melanoneura TaxID=428564 RepID=A0A8D8ZLV8_9HEMI